MATKKRNLLLRAQQGRNAVIQRIALGLAALLVSILLVGGPGAAARPGPQLQGVAATPTMVASSPTPPAPTPTPTPQPPTATPTPAALPVWDPQIPGILAQLGHPAKAILVSLANQVMYVFQNDTAIAWSYVTTGRPELPSPKGVWYVFARLHPTTFYSPFPPGSPYWYPPTFINYALEYHPGGYFLHDATWRHYYGPGTNIWHQNPDQTWESGTHGCVNMPLGFMRWLYDWTPIGTPVVLY